jgi:MFS family permease
MHPIAAAFHISMLEVTFVITITLWMRLIGATASGWICDRIGRKPLTIAILGYPVCNFAAGLSPLWRWKPDPSTPMALWGAFCKGPGASATPSQ